MTDKEAIKYLQQLYPNGGHCWLDEQRIEAISMAIKALQEEPQVKELSKTQHVNGTCEENSNSLTHESVSGLYNGDMQIDRWRQAVEAASNQRNYRRSKGFTETHDDYFVDGVQWADANPKKEPVSEELEKEIQTWADYFKKRSSEFNRFFFEKTARHFAEWQKQKMMKNAIDAVVHIDAGGYPYIPQIELYDYDKDIPLAKEGDKYKVILIKEE